MKKNLYFKNKFGHRCLAKNVTEEEARKIYHKFLEEHNWKTYYVRSWVEKDKNTWYDVGSWSEFFVWGFM